MSLNFQEDDDAIWNTLAEEERRQRNTAAAASPQTAANLGRIHQLAPSLSSGVKLAAAKANLSDEQIIEIAKTATKYQQETQEKKKKKRNIFGWAYDQLKTGSRYGMAALNFPLDMVQGAAGQIFDDNDSVAGWFISTDLGSLIANNDEAGDGFFIGGRAKELQAERARRYRGEINGSAFTIGRGLASTFLEEDTTAYRILSGALDAGVAVALPVAPGAKGAGQALRTAQELEKGGKVVDVLADATRVVGRGSKEIQLTDVNKLDLGIVQDAVDYEQANRFFRTSAGQRIVQRTAATTDKAEVWRLWGKKLDAETITELANATTDTEVMRVLSAQGRLGGQIASTTGVKGTKRLYRSLAQRNKLIASIPGGEGFSRSFAKIPRQNINLLQAETPRDQAEAIDTLDRALDLFKVGQGGSFTEVKNGVEVVTNMQANPTLRGEILNRAIDLLVSKDRQAIESFYEELDETFKQSMQLSGVNRNTVDAVYNAHKDYLEKLPKFQENVLGQAEDFDTAAKMLGVQQGTVVPVSGHQLASEVATKEFFIPDIRQVRRLTANMDWVFGKSVNGIWTKTDPNLNDLASAGQLRLPFAFINNVQEKVWRKVVTLTVGNFFRNIIDAQLSIALSGREDSVGLFNHPFQWYQFARKNKGLGDIMGQTFDEAVRKDMVNDALRNYRTATYDTVNMYWQDPVEAYRRAKRLGIFKGYERLPGQISVDVARAHGDEIGKLNADWSTRLMAQGYTNDQIIRIVKAQNDDEVLNVIAQFRGLDPANLSVTQRQNLLEEAAIQRKNAGIWYSTMKTNYKSKPIMDTATRQVTYSNIDLDKGNNLNFLLEGNFRRLQYQTGNNGELMRAVGQGRLQAVDVNNERVIGLGKGEAKPGDRVRFEVYDKKSKKFVETDGTVVAYDDTTGMYRIEPYAFTGNGDASMNFEELLTSSAIYDDPAMPQRVVGEIRDPKTPEAAGMMAAMDQMITNFHAYLHDKPIRILERSPLYRSLYYTWIDKLAISMDQASLKAVIDDITEAAAREGTTPEKYLTPGLWNKLKDLDANPDKLYGSLNRAEVSAFASGHALDEMQRMTYNAVERRNVTDVMRFISPFAQQQAEFLGRMFRNVTIPVAGGKLGYLPNPVSMRKMQFIVEGGREADPDGDGRGFFYKNPETGQWSFTFPLTGELTKLAFGVEAGLTLPVRGVVLGLDYRPGLGPFATVAASQLLPNMPKFDEVRNILLPYGERKNIIENLVPSYVQKVYEGVTGNTNGRFYANTYVETMQALAATGNYDLSTPDGKQLLLDHAREKAKWLTILRGVTQFTGPASGQFEYKIPTDQGDIYANGLSYALRNLQDINYDTAALRFIEIFGEDAFTYLANKTVSESGGLESSKEFYDFQRENGNLFAQYKEVAGYFGPKGTEFSFNAYTTQLEKGLRRRLTAEEVLEASERAIGMAYYKDMRANFGPTLNAEQRSYLKEYKEAIKQQYPGFGNMTFDPTKVERQVNQLFEAAKRSDLENNPVAKALNYYEQIRAEALAEANRRGFASLKSDKLGDLQEYLYTYAQALAEEYPEFARVYDRVLSQEID